ncbi:15483_t:CDS:1 [Cetraspora pellucida]|uniref:15483_t:CDS:1 n=1 Tax=Cetraspora pellucida TaxID=1433469 RepID=A0A9N9IET4_9GLOM|nr:15483_t:CDS:1 [Cetraspora pellucida]
MASELIWSYIISEENPSVEGFLKWAQNQTDNMFRLKYEQTFIYLQAIINFHTGVRFNRPLLKFAARRMFAPIWSARQHPIYRLIKIADEEQMLRLRPEIRNLIQERVVTSRSKLLNQHQGHDAILEEINKSLKSLIPPIPSQWYWEIVAYNCTNFSKLCTNIFNIIEYSESEANGPRTYSSFTTKSRRFWVQIRKAQFVNPNADNCIFQNLGGELILSKQMIRFSEITSTKRTEFIKATLIKKTPLGIWHPIPITCDEAELQKSEGSLKKSEILSIITSLIPSLGDSDQSRFCGLSNKSCEELVNILQEVKNILTENNISISEE